MRRYRNLAFAFLCATLLAAPQPVAAANCSVSSTGGPWEEESFSGSCDSEGCGAAMAFVGDYCNLSRTMVSFSCGECFDGSSNFSLVCLWQYWSISAVGGAALTCRAARSASSRLGHAFPEPR